MADDKSMRGSPDNKRLNKGERYEVAYAKRKAASEPAALDGSTPRPAARRKREAGAEKTVTNTAPAAKAVPDAVDLLVDDHLAVHACFLKYQKLMKGGAAAQERQTLARTICAMLKAHTTIEEEIFYPAARDAGLESDMMDEADVEHASAKDLIAQIEEGSPDDDHYDAKVTVLGEYIAHHVKEEHAEMFPKARRLALDPIDLRARMEARKAELVG